MLHEFHNGEVFGKGVHEVPCQRPYESLTGAEDITLTLLIKALGKIINGGDQL